VAHALEVLPRIYDIMAFVWTACKTKGSRLKGNIVALSSLAFCPEAGPPWLIVRFRLNPSVGKSGPLSVPRRRLRW